MKEKLGIAARVLKIHSSNRVSVKVLPDNTHFYECLTERYGKKEINMIEFFEKAELHRRDLIYFVPLYAPFSLCQRARRIEVEYAKV